MDFKLVSDEQLFLLLQRNELLAYQALYERMEKYARKVALSIRAQARKDAYDERDFESAFSQSFVNSLSMYNILAGVAFRSYFRIAFTNEYRHVLFLHSKEMSMIMSLDAPLSEDNEMSLHDVVPSCNSFQIKDDINAEEMLEKISQDERHHLSAKAVKMIVSLKLSGYSYDEISLVMNLSVKRIRNIIKRANI